MSGAYADLIDPPSQAHEVLTMGRVVVDLYPLETGIALENVARFGKFLGGSPTNVAVAAARHDRRAAVITRTGDDPFGNYVHQALRSLGVDDGFAYEIPGSQTSVAFCEIFPPDTFPLWFYCGRKAPDLDLQLTASELDAVAAAGVFWATATGLSAEPSRSAHFAAWDVRGRRPFTVLDLDYRPRFWASSDEAGQWMRSALKHATVAVANLDELEVAVGERDPDRGAQALLDQGVNLAVVKQGPGGVLAMTSDSMARAPAMTVDVLNGLGAGDAFGGALCHGLLAGWSLERVVDFANAAGAIVASRLECSTAMPHTEEVEALLEWNHDAA